MGEGIGHDIGPARLGRSSAFAPRVASFRIGARKGSDVAYSVVAISSSCLALPLFVAGVLADHHDSSVATDHLALVTDLLDAWLDLHRLPFYLYR